MCKKTHTGLSFQCMWSWGKKQNPARRKHKYLHFHSKDIQQHPTNISTIQQKGTFFGTPTWEIIVWFSQTPEEFPLGDFIRYAKTHWDEEFMLQQFDLSMGHALECAYRGKTSENETPSPASCVFFLGDHQRTQILARVMIEGKCYFAQKRSLGHCKSFRWGQAPGCSPIFPLCSSPCTPCHGKTISRQT